MTGTNTKWIVVCERHGEARYPGEWCPRCWAAFHRPWVFRYRYDTNSWCLFGGRLNIGQEQINRWRWRVRAAFRPLARPVAWLARLSLYRLVWLSITGPGFEDRRASRRAAR